MSSILIQNVLLEDRRVQVLIEGNRFREVAGELTVAVPEGAEVIDGSDYAIVPPFYNCHCHSAMTLLRGYADDMSLMDWLTKKIWPFEARLTEDDIYLGSRLAILEMIKSGTVFFADMYWKQRPTARAVEEMGVRANVCVFVIDTMDAKTLDGLFEELEQWHPMTSRLTKAIGPHSPYTCSASLLQRSAAVSEQLDIPLQIHVAETMREVQECREQHDGLSPICYLDHLGVLSKRVVAAHMVHLDENDVFIAAKRGIVSVYNPCSNMKLSSGIMPYGQMSRAGCRIALGTDGVASNNNLDMREEMKMASLLAKVQTSDPEMMPASETLRLATRNGAEAFGIDAGEIKTGKLADAVLVRLDDPAMLPLHNFTSNYVYAAGSGLIDTVICDGRILMRNRRVEGEDEIRNDIRKWKERH